MTRKILVVEDGEKHRTDADEFFRGLEGVDIVYAKNYDEAWTVLYNHRNEQYHLDGAIVDIYMPQSDASGLKDSYPPQVQDHIRAMATNQEPCGVGLAVLLEKADIPFVLNTAGYHHGAKYEWINGLCSSVGWPLIDASGDYSSEAETKDWRKAYESLEQRMK